ncbi:MAG: hypothetical protein LRY40_00885, partial [Shewanella fodinae]|nr:hypothetical protein [Shewanella fodinae]
LLLPRYCRKRPAEKQQQLSSARARLMQGWQHWQLLKRQRLQVLDHRLQRQEPLRHLQQLVQRFDEQQLRLSIHSPVLAT